MRPQTSYTEFYTSIKDFNTQLSITDTKYIYKFLDTKSMGFFSANRWNNFCSLFLSAFTSCDTNSDCLLDQSELSSCLDRPDTNIVKNINSAEFDSDGLVKEIIYSLDYLKIGGINLEKFIFLKRIIIGFRQYNVNGLLDKTAFTSAFRTTFTDQLIDDVDSEVAFRLGIYLMYDYISNFQIDFIQYFEICRMVNTYFSFGVTIGEGYLTKHQLMTNYEERNYPSKISSIMFEKYFNLFSEDSGFNADMESTKFDPNSLKFEDFCSLEFWSNIFGNYTDTKMPNNLAVLNQTGFVELIKNNKYFKKKYLVYVAYSNFEDLNSLTSASFTNNTITDYDFLTDFNVNLLETNSKHLNFLKKKTSVFDQISKTKSNTQAKTSLFTISLNEDDKIDNIAPLVDNAIPQFFQMLDIDSNKFLTFEEFMIFIKFVQSYDRLNKGNLDKRGVLSTNSVNSIYFIKVSDK